MQCPKCRIENPISRKFCRECGAKLVLACPECQFENLPSDKFCGDCGHDLTQPSPAISKELSFDEKIAKIQKYLPSGITGKILSQREKIEGEKRQVTVMFCDMKGFTPLSEKLGPEAVYAMMDEVYEVLIHKVHDYEGTVNEMTGDGVMALFGAPIALEDAPQRALRAALAIHREMARFNDRMRQEQGDFPPVKMRIGIHTGPVVVGTLGNDLRVEFKAVGDTVNLAARMEQIAEPGTTYVTDDTFKLTEGYFRFEALGEKEIKGKERPLTVYQVIAPSSRRTRFDVSAERGLTPLVGRGRELALLLDGFERAKSGRGQAFSIVSEAGCGKSRLLYEFRKALANEEALFLEGKCLSYGMGVAYHPVIDILKSLFDLQEEESDQGIKERVKMGLGIVGVDEAPTLPYLLELLSVKESGLEQIPMSREAKKDRMSEAFKRIVLKGSEKRPLVLAIEDLHWMDGSSADVIRDVLEILPGARILLIMTYRPQFVPTWGIKSYHNHFILHPLSNRESVEMVTRILGTEKAERSLEELIFTKTEGVPFFIEQLIKSLKDLGMIEKKENVFRLAKDIQHLNIPSTIQDIIMARVDSLPERAREVLQTGSVIEREFSYPLINRVTGFPEKELLSHLSTLKDSELLYERGVHPESQYIFKHALTRDVVYDTILIRKKKKLHEVTGNAIEALYKDNLTEYYEVLAEHYFLSETYAKAGEYSKLASRKAEKAASLNDAIAHTRKRITALERLPQTEDVQRKIIDSRTAVGLYAIQMNYHDEAQQAIDPIIDLAVKLDYRRRLCQIYTVLGANYLFVENDCLKALKVLEEALKIAEEVKDAVTAIFASYWFGVALSMNCEFERSVQYLQKALDINVAFNILWGIAAIKSDMSYLNYYYAGKIDLAYQTSREAVCIAEESGDILAKAFSYPFHGISCYGKGFLDDAEKHLLKALEITEKASHPLRKSTAHFILGLTYFDRGDFPKAKEHIEKANRILVDIRLWPSYDCVGKVGIARAKVLNKEKDIDLETLYSHARNTKVKLCQGEIYRYIGEILLNIDDKHLSEAETWIQQAIETDRGYGTKFYLGKDYAVYADLFKRKGDRLKSQENLGKAVEIFKECGADGWVTRTERELASLT